MFKFFWLIFLVFASTAKAQNFELNDLIDFTTLSVQKFDAHISKKEYRRDYYSPKETRTVYNYIQRKKSNENLTRTISIQEEKDKTFICYQTTSEAEFNKLKSEMSKEGFKNYSDKAAEDALLQKDNLIVNTSIEIKDSTTFFTVLLEKKDLPKAKDIFYAEDLLPVNSHENLCMVFGAANVKKDVFYYSATETNKCSILFPNTNREVVFIWNDESNYCNTAFLVIGGNSKTNISSNFNQQIEQNAWRSKQGVYSGMSLAELQMLNGKEVKFYSWHLDQAGMLAPKNTGQIDFNRINIVLNCLNCNETSFQQVNVINSENAILENRKIYISTMIILPEEDKQTTALRD
ncbi:MAG TPA: hypothetical protein VNA26_02650 [Chitinophagaceae bacterium]|nr:hypothetical protein [Chitinophagaceae bacterium]